MSAIMTVATAVIPTATPIVGDIIADTIDITDAIQAVTTASVA